MSKFKKILLENLEMRKNIIHPQKGEYGNDVIIKNPSSNTSSHSFLYPDSIACVVPGDSSNVPTSLYGVAFSEYTPPNDWNTDSGINKGLVEPLIKEPKGKRIATGIVIREPDGRVWIHEPTNHFANTQHSFPKGKTEDSLSLQANAIKETFEETGLHARILKHLGDVERSTSIARYYLGERIGGHPSKMGWESQSVKLVPQTRLKEHLNVPYDHAIVDKLRELNESICEGYSETKLRDLAIVKTNFPEADYWVRRKGSEDTVGQVINEYSPENIGIKITRKDLLLPEYHRYVMINQHLKGYWKNKSTGTLNLKNIKVEDVANMEV